MKRLMIIVLLTTVCSTSFAGVSSEAFDSWYDDFLALLNLYREHEVPLEEINIDNDSEDVPQTGTSQRFATSEYSGLTPHLDDLSPLVTIGISGEIIYLDQVGFDNSNSPVITNPEPCSIILSSLGLGVVGYLKRRRAI